MPAVLLSVVAVAFGTRLPSDDQRVYDPPPMPVRAKAGRQNGHPDARVLAPEPVALAKPDLFRRAYQLVTIDVGGGWVLDPRHLRFNPVEDPAAESHLELRLNWGLDGARAVLELQL